MGRLTAHRSSAGALRLLGLALAVLFLPLPDGLDAQQAGPPFGPGVERSSPDQSAMEAEEVFRSVLRALEGYAFEEHGSEELWEKAIRGIIRELDDPYAAVLSREEVEQFEEESTGNYAGIGVQITELNAQVTITAVFPNTPADEAGLMVGDRIVGVDEEDSDAWSVEDVSSRIRGEEGTSVLVRVRRDGIDRPIPHEITRRQVHVPAVRAERIFDDVGYVLLDRVARNSASEVDSVMTALEGSRGMILDLRRNPGGYLDESLRLADLFLDRGDHIVTTRARNPGLSGADVAEEKAYARSAPRDPDTPLIILVDGFSASASEIVAGALQDHDRAIILGQRTFGKGSVQSVIPLPAGRLLRVTSGEWYTPLGRSLSIPRDSEGREIGPGARDAEPAPATDDPEAEGAQPGAPGVEVDTDSLPRYTSPAGRTIIGGGGVFPDLEITGDTLTSEEQSFVSATVEHEIALASRIQERAFDAAQEARDSAEDLDAPLDPAVVDGLVRSLVSDGVPEALITDGVRGYLGWRLSVAYYQRLEREHRALEVQAQRDPVLAMAVEMLKDAGSLSDLFAAVERAGGVGGLSTDHQAGTLRGGR
ncbi:MAG: S41 family peptidase [Gemmatimonadales bacterium]|nr:MAG: S41 family peptidase [Gemmatimonadales bacterium]